MLDGGLDHLRQTVERDEVAFLKSSWPAGEQLEHAVHFVTADERHHDYGCDPESAAAVAIYSGIVFRIVALQNLAGANALAGQSRIDL